MRGVRKFVLQAVRIKLWLLSLLSKKAAARQAFHLFCTPQHRVRGPLPAVFEKAEVLEFPFEGYMVRGYRCNHPAPKKAVILHGFESGVVNFESYVLPLSQKGYEVLAFDAPAHGRSSGRSITVLTYKNMIRHIWEQWGPVDAFISHSFGGLSLALALEEIEHDGHLKVVFIAPAAETVTAIDHFFRILRLDTNVRKAFDRLIGSMSGKPPEWYSLARLAGHIRAQVLFLQDTDDAMTPLSDVEPIIRKNHPNFRFVISQGLGHRRIYRDAGSMEEIMKFL